MTVTRRGHFTAQIIRIDLHRLWMQPISRRVCRGFCIRTVWVGRAVISFHGRSLDPDLILRGGFNLRTGAAHPTRCGRRLLSALNREPLAIGSHVTAVGGYGFLLHRVIAGCDLALPRDALLMHPSSGLDGKAPAAARRSWAFG